MSNPLIGITPSLSDDGRTFKLYDAYCALLKEAGGEAILLPYGFTSFSLLDGAIFSGGGDVDGSLGGYENSDVLDGVFEARDAFEIRLFEAAFEHNLPMLGICRGHQILNVALKGSLYRDIAEAGFQEEHRLGGKAEHEIRTAPGSLARKLLGETAAVWSTHHQAVKDLGRGFRATAWSPEGVVEAIEHENGRILGLQTHPERMNFLPPFSWLVEACKR
ncbi:MAG: gamma-glutamyl-gamma-aminobutyrate hydrolase family protein [Clostridiaceae bacterium]|nr:gamma-glutamyl-gamma-aminobutyrate hydrolase family protein [Eubacteriales bacterium]